MQPPTSSGLEPGLDLIRARTQRQAMDWSLVLASQEIESAIHWLPETQAWVLAVSPADTERALATIRQYRLENRRWGWRQEVSLPGFSFHWGVLLWCWVLALVFWSDDAMGEWVRTVAAVKASAVGQGEWWRLFTATWLHRDIAHLAANATTGFVLLGLAMARFGPMNALGASLLAGGAANGLAWLLRPREYTGLGASGVVMAALGLLAVQSLALWREGPLGRRQVLTALLGGGFLFLMLGADPNADVLAHAGGFVGGLVLGAGLALMRPATVLGWRLNLGSAVGAVALTAWTWVLALSRRGGL